MLRKGAATIIIASMFTLTALAETVVVIPQTAHLRGEGLVVGEVEAAITEYFGLDTNVIGPRDLRVEAANTAVEDNAQRSIQRALSVLSEGKSLYENLEMMDAIRKFVEARAIFYENLLYLDDDGPLTLALFYLGLIHGTMNDESSQMGYFMELVSINEHYKPDPALAPPMVVNQLNKARSRIATERRSVYIGVTTNPQGAEVRLNGRLLGNSPISNVKVFETGPTGDAHAFSVTSPGFRPHRAWLNLKNAQPNMHINLKPMVQRDYIAEFTHLFDQPSSRDASVRLARELISERNARELFSWTLHPMGDYYLLAISKVDRMTAKTAVGSLRQTDPYSVRKELKNIFALLLRPGSSSLEIVEGTILPSEKHMDFRNSFLGYFNPSDFGDVGEIGTYRDGEEQKLYKNPWLWVGVAGGVAVLAGAGVLTYFLLKKDGGDTGEPTIKNQVTVIGTIKW